MLEQKIRILGLVTVIVDGDPNIIMCDEVTIEEFVKLVEAKYSKSR